MTTSTTDTKKPTRKPTKKPTKKPLVNNSEVRKKEVADAMAAFKKKGTRSITVGKRKAGYQGLDQCCFATMTIAAFEVAGYINIGDSGLVTAPKEKPMFRVLQAILTPTMINEWQKGYGLTPDKLGVKGQNNISNRFARFVAGNGSYSTSPANVKTAAAIIRKGGGKAKLQTAKGTEVVLDFDTSITLEVSAS